MTKLCDICHKENALPDFKVCQKHYDQIMMMRNALAFEEE